MDAPCAHCGARAKRVCGACGWLRYCGERCAAADWPLHCEAEPHAAEGVHALDLIFRDDATGAELWVGGITALQHLDEHGGMDAVLTVIQRDARNDPTWIRAHVGTRRAWLWLPHADVPSDDMSMDFERAVRFIRNHLQKGHRVLLHCHAGRSRSVTMAAAYLLRWERARFPTVRSALEWIAARREGAWPNRGFVAQLEQWIGSGAG